MQKNKPEEKKDEEEKKEGEEKKEETAETDKKEESKKEGKEGGEEEQAAPAIPAEVEIRERIIFYYLLLEQIMTAARLNEISVLGWGRYKEFPGIQAMFKNGYPSLSSFSFFFFFILFLLFFLFSSLFFSFFH